MADARYTRLYAGIEEKVAAVDRRTSLYNCMKRGRDKRRDRLAVLPEGDAWREDVKAIKDRCIEQMDELVDRFRANAEARGAQVFLAKDGAEAIGYVLRLAEARGAKAVAKSKSLTSEEIFINEPMLEAGLQVVETDLGELILQLAHEKPYHLVFPAVHKLIAEVARIFEQETGKTIADDIPAIMEVVRAYLRPVFLNADIGMTGANVGVAENGSICIETNEGNARLVSAVADCHVCIMGREKIVETVEEAMLMVMAHPISALGQFPTTYVTWMAGRQPMAEGGAPRESHIIILDNGRSRLREEPVLKEALNCIRCGACMNICPTYGVVGGHLFGYVYPGPIGIPWTAAVHGLEKAGDFAPLCVSCGLCKEICPAKIDIPLMIAEVKHRDAKTHPHPGVNKLLMNAEAMSKAGSATAPLSNWALKNPLFRKVMEQTQGIDARRVLPPFRRETTLRWYAGRGKATAGEPVRRVAYFVDLFANYNAPELGRAAIEYLESLGCAVVLPEQQGCNYPAIGYGDLDLAREAAAYNVRRFAPFAREGYDIVATEPTATFCLKSAWPKLIPVSDEARLVADRTKGYFELVNELAPPPGDALRGKRFGCHCSCHQRPIDASDASLHWLRGQGADVDLIETGTCCGMAGTFGMKKGPLGYLLSNAVGEPLFQAFKESGVDAIVTESSVCAMHLREGTGIPVHHPLEFVRDLLVK